MNMKTSVFIQGTMEHIWNQIIEINHCVDTISDLIGVCSLDRTNTKINKTAFYKLFRYASNQSMWVTHSQSDYSYQTRAENNQIVYTSIISVAQKGELIEFTVEFKSEFQSFFSKFLSLFIRPIMKKKLVNMLKKDLENIRNRIEMSKG